ncbi:DUF1963 domain-containing protein [Mesorhizobium sp. M00.F.Ca.ET.186.01.1.1]|nr:DUF1963 domain-containing protein [Mesorhizobium sp. M00.F.Ca.ET.186.01.1.1]
MKREGDHKSYYVSWGDSGVANFFIRKQDLLRLDFSQVFHTWDACNYFDQQG